MKPTKPAINARRHHLLYHAPVHRWDEGLPLGNGLIGLLVWGDGHPLNLSVDRSDLWDNRPDPRAKERDWNWKKLRQLVDQGEMKSVYRIFENDKDSTLYPTKLPCGRLVLDFGAQDSKAAHSALPKLAFESHLDFATAISVTRIGRAGVTAYVHAEKPLVVVRVRGARPNPRFLCAFDQQRKPASGAEADQLGATVDKLGYPPLEKGRTKDGMAYILQRCAQGTSFTVAWTTVAAVHDRRRQGGKAAVADRRCSGEWALFLTIQQATNNQSPLPLAAQALKDARTAGAAELEKSHIAWWRNYWRRGHVRLPDARIEHLWYAEMYKLAASSRAGAPPISLQGVWTADEMNIPPWRGDFHHDLNTQMSYWPVHTAGRIEQSRVFAEWLRKLLPKYQEFARDFYGESGANVPASHGLTGEIVMGWAPYVYSRANGAWLIQHLWWHYRHTMDQEFLRDIAYPFIREQTRFCVSQLTLEADGKYHVHYSSSPEYFHNWREAWATDSTYDLSLIRYALETAGAAANLLGVDRDEAKKWDRIRTRLQPYHRAPAAPKSPAPEGGLAVWKGQRLTESHRHPAQCMPIFPLGDLNVEGGDADRQLIQDTLSELECMGTGFWCGYSFAWLACLAARIREPNRALWNLKQYLDGFMSPNTFHLNGDYRKTGASRFHYRPFTLEGNFGAAHAVNEMLLQSWGDRIRLFPAMPSEWRDAAFSDLRAEGAFVVSAWRKDGEFLRAEILSEKGVLLRLEHPHPKQSVRLQEHGGGRTSNTHLFPPGREIVLPTRAGGRYLFTPRVRKT